jgi:hypothetical protein
MPTTRRLGAKRSSWTVRLGKTWSPIGAPPAPRASARHSPHRNEPAAVQGVRECAREDSNLHGPYGPQGPQPWRPSSARCGFRLPEGFSVLVGALGFAQFGPQIGPRRNEPGLGAAASGCSGVRRPRAWPGFARLCRRLHPGSAAGEDRRLRRVVRGHTDGPLPLTTGPPPVAATLCAWSGRRC